MAKICRFCGGEMKDHDRVCPHCKHEVVDTCAVCGTHLYDNEAFCPGCGSPAVVKCVGCGRELYGGEKFCPYCGTRNEVLVSSFNDLGYNLAQFGGFGLGSYGSYGLNGLGGYNSPVVLPPVTCDGTTLNTTTGKDAVKLEAIERTRPQPIITAKPVEVHTVNEPVREKKSKLGIVGFIFAILSFIPLFWFISIPCCAVAIKRNNGHRKLAIAGLVITIIWILAWIGLFAYMFAVDKSPVEKFLSEEVLQPLGLINKGELFEFKF